MNLANPETAFAFSVDEIAFPRPDGRQDDLGLVAKAVVQRARARLEAWNAAGASGAQIVSASTEVMDRTVSFLHAAAVADFTRRNARVNQKCAVLAQGGYGRGELNVQSDIDLLFLYPWKANPYVETVAEIVVPALWDAGLQVGSAMRNVRECCRLAARDLKVKTALLDARYLCGDRSPYEDFEARVVEEVWAPNQTAFFREKLKESEERHARMGDSVYLLQPQLKEGMGGLRDLHTALWMAKVKFKTHALRELVAIGVLRDQDVAALDHALDFLWRVRNGMHLATGSHQDHLTFDLQDRLAPELGFGTGRRGI